MATSSGFDAAVKIPPHNLEAEVAILGGILINQDALVDVRALLSEEDFYREAHRIIYCRMLELEDKSEPIDALTLGNILEQNGEFQRIGGNETLANIVDAVSTSAGILSYAKIVRDLSIRRQLILKCSEIAEECFTGANDVSSLLDKTEHNIFSIREQQKTGEVLPLKDALIAVFSQLTTRTGEDGISGLSTGFADIDRLTLGMQPADLIILAARPGIGKTALALNIAYNAVKKTMEKDKPKASLVFSLEMSSVALVTRLLSLEAGIDGKRLRGGSLSYRETESVKDAADRLSEMPIFIDDSAGLRPFEIKAKCRRIKKEHKIELGIVVIDYLQLMEGSRRFDSREQEIASISRMLKGLAKEMNVPVLALSQLNRQTEIGNKNLRPQLSNLRESGAIEQDADIVMFIHSERDKETDLPIDIAEVIIAKHRNGPTGIAKLKFKKNLTRFENYTEREPGP